MSAPTTHPGTHSGTDSGPELTPLIAGNWKMHGVKADLATLADIAGGLSGLRADVMICPPATLIGSSVAQAHRTSLLIGAQDCHPTENGAHTGDISVGMLKDAGATAVIVGHSERRSDHGETDAAVKAKADAAVSGGLTAIVCVGETAGQRQLGLAERVVLRQLRASLPDDVSPTRVVVAYEPVWAIGTGLTATPDDVAAMHASLRSALMADYGATGAQIRLLYGGSVKPDNAAELLATPNVNGALVGGASLKAADFLAIVRAAE